jgi:hypothetical protein
MYIYIYIYIARLIIILYLYINSLYPILTQLHFPLRSFDNRAVHPQFSICYKSNHLYIY